MNTNYKGRYILQYIGVMLMFLAGVILLPLIILPFYWDEAKYALCFAIPAGIALLSGFILSKIHVPEDYRLSMGSDAIIVVGIWILAAFFSALPFMLAGMLNFTQSYFEAMSGWTTTGLSVVDVTKAPKIFLFFRSVMQFFGGFGIVLVVVSALSESLGMRLYTAEGHNDKLLPNLAKSARLILKIYTGYFITGTIIYIIFGMPAFDAVNHAMAALSTGGFSTKTESIGAYNNLPIELVTVVLMLLGETNFFAHLLLVRRKFGAFFRLGETKLTLITIAIAVPILAVMSLIPLYGILTKALRISFFNLVSALTTTGFSTVAFNDWPAFAWLMMILLMLIGGGAGSTAGGIKSGRVNILMKQIGWSVKRKFMPERMVNQPVIYRPEGKTGISPDLYTESANYALTYLALLFIGTGILAACGYSLQDSLFEFASALGTVGLSIGLTSIDTSPVALWTMTTGMLLGRLEIFVIFYAIIKATKTVRRSNF
ncbi:MAG: TrkH family potassium uptake protein [Dehalobacterium sp.]